MQVGQLCLILLLPLVVIWGYLVIESFRAPKRLLTLSEGSSSPLPENPPLVSILIPMRNEEENIAECLQALFDQRYPNVEIIVVNDRSTDRTVDIASKLEAAGKIRLLNVEKLPEGWSGKNYALHTGVEGSSGEWFLLVDADVRLSPYCLKEMMAHVLQNDVAMLSLLGRMVHKTFYEKMLVPALGVTLMFWYPPKWVNDRRRRLAFANGQCLLVRREAYEGYGGHEAVRGELLEDIAMSKKCKAAGGNVQIACAPTLYSARMYGDLLTLFRGWSRIFYYGFNKSAWRILVHITAVMYMSILPFCAMVFAVWAVANGVPCAWPCLFLSAGVTVLGLWAVSRTYWVSASPRRFAILHPISCVFVIAVLLHTLYKIVSGRGILWRDTVYPTTS